MSVNENPQSLAHLPVVYMAYDTAIHANQVAAAATFWHPLHGELLTLQFALRVFRPSSDEGEWLARLVPLYQLANWSGHVILVTDKAARCTHCFTRGPRPQTVIAHYFKFVMAACAHLRFRELWTRAQHDIGHEDPLAALNRGAHNLAKAYLHRATSQTVCSSVRGAARRRRPNRPSGCAHRRDCVPHRPMAHFKPKRPHRLTPTRRPPIYDAGPPEHPHHATSQTAPAWPPSATTKEPGGTPAPMASPHPSNSTSRDDAPPGRHGGPHDVCGA